MEGGAVASNLDLLGELMAEFSNESGCRPGAKDWFDVMCDVTGACPFSGNAWALRVPLRVKVRLVAHKTSRQQKGQKEGSKRTAREGVKHTLPALILFVTERM
eukprot:737452-Pelagomonas_calceolata.AAC.1